MRDMKTIKAKKINRHNKVIATLILSLLALFCFVFVGCNNETNQTLIATSPIQTESKMYYNILKSIF